MADNHTRDELAQLRADFEAQRTITAALQAEVARLRHRPQRRVPRRFLPLALVALLVVLTPLSLLAAAPFNDLTGGVHDANIGLLYDAGITKGCVPNVSYCPTANVTREEMASFLARTAGLGPNPPVANAKTAQMATSAGHAGSADNATNAAQLNGQAASFYQPAGQPIANATNAGNANTVGGYAPNGLVRAAWTGTSSSLALIRLPQTYGQTLTIQAPAAGLVLVTGGLTFEGGGSCPCVPVAKIRHIQSGGTTPDAGPTVTGSPFNYADAAFGYAFAVQPGANTFDFRVSSDISGAYAYTGQMAALFVPFNATGGTTVAP